MITISITLLGNGYCASQEKKPELNSNKWLEASAPGDAHKRLSDLAGNWDIATTMFWIDNSATAMYTAEGNFDKTGKILTMFG